MRRLRTPLSVIALLAMLLLVSLNAFGVSAQDGTSDLLANPGFEPPFPIAAGLPPMQVANGWLPWYIGTQPQFYASSDTIEGIGVPRVLEGDGQQFFSYYNAHTGGVYQSVSGLVPGETYTFSVNAYVWSTNGSDPNVSADPGGVVIQVGIDPNGGSDGASASIVWSDAVELYDAFNQYTTSTAAVGDTITVWVRSTVTNPVQYSVVYLDNASLVGPSAAATEEATSEVTAEASAEVPTEAATEAVVESTTEATLEQPTEAATTEASVEAPAATVETIAEASAEVKPPTETPLPPTETPVPPTETPVPPTETPLPPTETPLPPTETPVPPTETPVVPTETPVVPTAQVIMTETPTPLPTLDVSVFPYSIHYTVQNGDNPSDLSARFNSDVFAILAANGLNVDSVIYVGQDLVIPLRVPGESLTTTPQSTTDPLMFTATAIIAAATQTAGAVQAQPLVQAVQPTSTYISSNGCYYVRYGDTLSIIAARLHMTVRELARINRIVNINFVWAGQCLRTVAPATPTSAAPTATTVPPTATLVPQQTHVVQFGDTLYGIALRYHVSVRAILQANNLPNPNIIYVGQRLIIPTNP
ncbi:MAG: LysM peptidoglycan-binding domain-containing protein [Anaerolineae bacterium]